MPKRTFQRSKHCIRTTRANQLLFRAMHANTPNRSETAKRDTYADKVAPALSRGVATTVL